MTPTLLLANTDVIVTMDSQRREIRNGDLLIAGNRIVALEPAGTITQIADEIIDMRGHIVLPGLINTHHHMYQSLTRAIPGAQDATLFDWLRRLYPIWARLTPEMVRISTQTAMAELLLSGCTTTSDHLYLFPNGCRLDDQIEGAETIGMRFHAARGSMSLGESQGGLPPDSIVETESMILRDTQRVIETYHDSSPFSMRRIVVAPCSPFSVSPALMRASAELARVSNTTLHTHLAENDTDISYSHEVFGMTPAEYAEDLGWVGTDVWHAHCVKLDRAGITRFGQSGTGIAHCPCSNMRLGSGIAPVQAMLREGVRVGLGVDGSASNDGAHLLGEARQAMLLSRVGHDMSQGPMMKARTALELATRGGASVLGRGDIGHLAPNMAADIAAFDLRELDYAGALTDPVAALLFCTSRRSTLTIVNGRILVRDGELLSLDLRQLIDRHNKLSRQLVLG